MKEINYTELEREIRLEENSPAILTEEEQNLYMEWLMNHLTSLSERLRDSDIPNELTLDSAGIPGVNIHLGEDKEVYVTFLQSEAEGEDGEEQALLHLSALMQEPGAKEPSEKVWEFFAGEIPQNPDLFMTVIRLFGQGAASAFLPEGAMLTPEETGKTEKYTEETIRLLPRTAALSGILANLELTEDMAVTDGDTPCILLAGSDGAVALCYESVPLNEELFLLHLRADAPFDQGAAGITAGEYCDTFNALEGNGLITARPVAAKDETELFQVEGAREYVSFCCTLPEYESCFSENVYETLITELFDCCLGLADTEVP